MPIRIDNELPAKQSLEIENIFVMSNKRADTQDIRPLHIIILNLMPTKIDTETQLLRLLSNTPLQVNVDFLQVSSHTAKHTSKSHMDKFYYTFDQIKDRKYDGMIITGAPVEQMPFEEVDYWDELCRIMDWTKTNVYSTFHICWGAQAGLYYRYGIPKHPQQKDVRRIPSPQFRCDPSTDAGTGRCVLHSPLPAYGNSAAGHCPGKGLADPGIQ